LNSVSASAIRILFTKSGGNKFIARFNVFELYFLLGFFTVDIVAQK